MVPASANYQFSVHVCGALRSRQSVEQFFAAVEGGDQAGQIVGSDGLLVVDVEFEAVIARVKELTCSVRPPWPKMRTEVFTPE